MAARHVPRLLRCRRTAATMWRRRAHFATTRAASRAASTATRQSGRRCCRLHSPAAAPRYSHPLQTARIGCGAPPAAPAGAWLLTPSQHRPPARRRTLRGRRWLRLRVHGLRCRCCWPDAPTAARASGTWARRRSLGARLLAWPSRRLRAACATMPWRCAPQRWRRKGSRSPQQTQQAALSRAAPETRRRMIFERRNRHARAPMCVTIE